MYKLIRSFLFKVDPEKAHHFVFTALKTLLAIPGMKWLWKKLYVIEDKRLEREVFGITFRNPVGLAAGLDKNAELFNELDYCGFGFIEVGTVTPRPQDGNEKPRLFRLPEDNGLINRMGFNNGGVEVMVERLKQRKSGLIIGGNIGKNKVTPNEEAVSDYIYCFNALFDSVDYFVVNVSSPNTPNLRELQDKEPLLALLNTLHGENKKRTSPKPILLKIAPDLSDSQLLDIIDIIKESGIQGVIATNTTISREGLTTDQNRIQEIGAGGLSGKPVKNRSTEVIRFLSEKSGKAFPIIGVGGIFTAADAIEKLEAGADLVQVYTGFIYEGPAMIKNINKEILRKYKK
ncbi:quinone-dependent dihydroorotate dehydrogenase [Wandonia haliotis]|uniref:Dihydroorotate dehydrogenase (quinone) n=1 Tax=Wandonia haliotis TaxID=574963 RepID=A0ABP3XZ47_9FLAO